MADGQSFSVAKPRTALLPDASGQRCISLIVPDDDAFVWLIAGMYGKLTDAENWFGSDADRVLYANKMLDSYTETDWSACIVPEATLPRWTRVWVNQAVSQVGNGLTWSGATTRLFGGTFAQGTPAINDELGFKVTLAPGSYNVHVYGLKASNRGIQTLYFDGSLILTQDWYSAATVDIFEAVATIEVSLLGEYDVASVIASKNASSSAYGMSWIAMDFERTS